jgi:hypothetical protein
MTMSKKLSPEELAKIESKFQTQWKNFRGLLRNQDYKSLPINDQATLIHRIGHKIKIVHGLKKVIDYLAKYMPNLSLVPEAETDPVDTGIMTHTDLVVDTRKIEAFLKHNAMKGIAGTYSMNPSGEFDSVWIHQDECFWEIMFINFRDN